MSTPSLAAARAILAAVTGRGGANNVGHLEAHGLLRRAMNVEETSPATWRATRAALDAVHAGATDPAAVAKAIDAAHANDGPAATYPAHLYGAGGPTDKPSQYAGAYRRQQLLAASPLGRSAMNRAPDHK